MSKIRSKNTRPEKVLKKMMREVTDRGLRYNLASLPGSPDIVVHSLRLAIFMEGCFWHSCPKHGRVPKSNVEFWEKKLARNRARDRRNRAALRELGWTVWRIWEHDLRKAGLVRTRRNIRRRLARLEARL